MPTLNQLFHEARWRRHWQVLLLVFGATSAFFAFTPAGPLVVASLHDKLNHLLAFASMGLAAALSRPADKRHAASAAGGLLAYGGFIELVQALLPTRHADAADLLADAAGIALGLLTGALLRLLWRPTRAAVPH